jgi:hypothetical protein
MTTRIHQATGESLTALSRNTQINGQPYNQKHWEIGRRQKAVGEVYIGDEASSMGAT